ncbi:hypothetical protein [Celerinatantimonas sp. YJH-8]|uniref:hypothetical protein n=1 Tax=Celerinatantimonas sp. YJH-8 TaxID=3228714 RepID=UPI0038CAF425
MSLFFVIEPEVSGGLGTNTVIDTSIHPPKVTHLNYEFDDWLGDDLVESFPCFVITSLLAKGLNEKNFSGFELDSVEISVSDVFYDVHSAFKLPDFKWLKVVGKAGIDDFGLSDDYRLVVSENVMALFKNFKFLNADIEKYNV